MVASRSVCPAIGGHHVMVGRMTVFSSLFFTALLPAANAQDSTVAVPRSGEVATPEAAPKDGAAGSSATLSEEELVQRLHAQGYSDISNVVRDGSGWIVKAKRDGKTVTLSVGQSGVFTER
jgi:hypothetical protein